LSDERLGQRLSETIEDVSDFATRLTQIQTEISVRSEYLLALIITKTQVSTLPIELSKYQGSTEGRVYGRQAALAVGITIPLMFVGLIIRKHLARGFSFGMVRR
jgi:ABC-type glycerol-3-phosphate transport system permease component